MENNEEMDQMILDTATQNKHGRRMSYAQIGMQLDISEYQVRIDCIDWDTSDMSHEGSRPLASKTGLNA
jgi:hypothetical protein